MEAGVKPRQWITNIENKTKVPASGTSKRKRERNKRVTKRKVEESKKEAAG